MQEACPVLRGQAWHVGSWSLVSARPSQCLRSRPGPGALDRRLQRALAPPSSGVSSASGCLSFHFTPALQCSKSCGSGTRRRQVVCTIGPPGRCADLQSSKPAEVEACNRQPCHLPQGTRAGRAAPPCPLAACLVHTSRLGLFSRCFPTPLAIAAPPRPPLLLPNPCELKLAQCVALDVMLTFVSLCCMPHTAGF